MKITDSIGFNLPFVKMHGLGNDFVIFDGRRGADKKAAILKSPSVKFLQAVSSRNRGVGCDQLIVLRDTENADVHMDIYNADGSMVGVCGNATRCVARIMFEEFGKDSCLIETKNRMLKAWKDKNGLIAVDFGEPGLDWQQIPLREKSDTLYVEKVKCEYMASPCCVSMGNPHAVFFVDDVNSIPLERKEVGSALEHDPMFPERCNIEIAQIINPQKIRMRVWERGTGITEACGSGSCATLVAAVRRGLTERRAEIVLDGGVLEIEWQENNHILMIGSASLSFKGVLSEELL
ncbi:MAG: diaminopimelate epimerase [Alphaproteobacteria bacterium]|nr:diaminopimelate epimerase [Alphaproteobacteria bacterium]